MKVFERGTVSDGSEKVVKGRSGCCTLSGDAGETVKHYYRPH